MLRDVTTWPASYWRLAILMLACMMFLVRLLAPSDLESNAQVLNVGYISDLMWGSRHWLVQHDLEGAVMSKPPIHTWTMVPFAMLFGVDRFALSLPSFFAITILALIVFEFGRHYFGIMSSGLAALSLLLAAPYMKQIALVRTDPLFALFVSYGAFAAFHAMMHRGSWIYFWLAAVLSTLTKGPLGLVLSAGGLMAKFWNQHSEDTSSKIICKRWYCSFWSGVTLFFTLTLGWFLAAWYYEGHALINKMFFDELLFHAIGKHNNDRGWFKLIYPSLLLLVRYLPFSIFLIISIKRIFTHPAEHLLERNLERFLASWLFMGLIIFTIASHQRADHLVPLWPACALLVGRELNRLLQRYRRRYITVIILIFSITLFSANCLNTFYQRSGSDYERENQLAKDAEQAGKAYLMRGLDPEKLYHFRTPLTLQMYLKTFRPWVNATEIDTLLHDTAKPLDIALWGTTGLSDLGLKTRLSQARLIFRWPEDSMTKALFQVYRIQGIKDP